MDLVRFRRIADAERDRLREQECLLRKGGATLIERHPVWAARSLVVETALAYGLARREMAKARIRGRRVDLYVEGLSCILFYKVLSRIARSVGHSGISPQESLLGVVDEGCDLDDERARRMLRAGHDELLRGGREVWTMAYRLTHNDPDVPTGEKERALAALTGLVDGVFSLTRAKNLRIALEREGVRGGSDEFVQLLANTVFEALHDAPPDQGLEGLRSKVSSLLRNPRETRQAEFEASQYATEPGNTDAQPAEGEMGSFAAREERLRRFHAENDRIARAGLSKQERQVFLMARTLTPKQIADRLERSPGQVGVELFRARKKHAAVSGAV
jgi:DNA-binding CsgD family transcriptional regulator